MIETLMVTVGNQPLAALAAIVTLKPAFVVPIVSVETSASLAGLNAACIELGWAGTFRGEIQVEAHEPARIAATAKEWATQEWFAEAHFAYTGGTKPMSWAWASVWDDVKTADAKAWYVADDLGQLVPGDGSPSLPVDTSKHLSLEGLCGMHGWEIATTKGAAPLETDLAAATAAVAGVGTVDTARKVRPVRQSRGFDTDVPIAVIRGWRLTLIKRVAGQAGIAETELAELSRWLGGSLACSVVIGGEPQSTDPLDNRDHLGREALARQRRLWIPADTDPTEALTAWFASGGSMPGSAASSLPDLASLGGAVGTVEDSSDDAHDLRVDECVEGTLVVTLGLNPLATIAAAYLHRERHGTMLPRIIVLHTAIANDGAEDESDGLVAFRLSQRSAMDALRAALLRFSTVVKFAPCGPHDDPAELDRSLEQRRNTLTGAWLDATGGTKALTLGATRAWRSANASVHKSAATTVSYTVSSGNWVCLRFLDGRAELKLEVPQGFLAISEMVGMHGYGLRESDPPKQSELEQAPPIVRALEAKGWTCIANKDLVVQSSATKNSAQLDLIAIKGLVLLIVELKSGTLKVFGEIDRTIRRARLAGGSQSLAVVIGDKQPVSSADLAVHFPSGRAMAYRHGEHEMLAKWADELAT